MEIPRPYKTIQVEVAKRVATIVLNRPEVRNAFSPPMVQELTQAFESLPKFRDVHAVVLRGAGKSFCSGADLGYMKAIAENSFEQNEEDAKSLDHMFWAMHECSIPVIGQIHGHAMGGGLGLVALCDVAAAVSDTQFSFSEVRLGISPAVISPYVLEKMQASYAYRYMLSGEVFSADVAREAGLLAFAGGAAEVEEFVTGLIKKIDQNGPEAVRATKKLLKTMRRGSWKQRREKTAQVIAERRGSEEGQEGLKAFLEKREPSWKPKDGV
jgi:methylglutaconyl-CoA hydratase